MVKRMAARLKESFNEDGGFDEVDQRPGTRIRKQKVCAHVRIPTCNMGVHKPTLPQLSLAPLPLHLSSRFSLSPQSRSRMPVRHQWRYRVRSVLLHFLGNLTAHVGNGAADRHQKGQRHCPCSAKG